MDFCTATWLGGHKCEAGPWSAHPQGTLLTGDGVTERPAVPYLSIRIRYTAQRTQRSLYITLIPRGLSVAPYL